jgi:hypothetical protein
MCRDVFPPGLDVGQRQGGGVATAGTQSIRRTRWFCMSEMKNAAADEIATPAGSRNLARVVAFPSW